MHKLLTSLFILSLVSCFGSKKNNFNSEGDNLFENIKESIQKGDTREAYIKRHCINDRFAQGQDDNLYGLECLEGKQLVIQTSHKGQLISTSGITDSETGLKLEGELNFKNKFYNTSYDIKENKGSAEDIPWLLKFLPADEEFTGNLNAKYRIIFKTLGNYLVLFKASHHLNELPYTERTSLKVFRDGHLRNYASSDEQKGDYYMVPFIGYPIKYCKAETILNAKGKKTTESRAACENSYLQNAKYIKINPEDKKTYNFITKSKKDLFPSKYFEGLWYYSSGSIESASREGELAPFSTYLVNMKKERNTFNLIDMSGDVEDRNRRSLGSLPIKWLEFEPDKKGNNQFYQFGEKEQTDNDYIKRPYVQVEFNKMRLLEQIELKELINLTITPDYLSFVHIAKVPVKATSDGNLEYETLKWKTSFLRAKAVDTAGFVPRKWFLDDHNHIFGILPTSPQAEGKRAEVTQSELLDHYRMIKFNTSLNTEKEKETKTKIIKWHFSKNSTKDPDYRAVAQKAIEIYNQAFKYLTKNSDKKLQIELVTDEDQDLGDLRYNILNLVKTQDLAGNSFGGLLGVAPSYVNPDTGQIIGTTSNIIIHNQEVSFDKMVRQYIRYEIFHKDKRTKEENNIHAVSPHIRKQIHRECPEVDDFIGFVKNNRPQLRPRTELSDKEVIISCGKKLTVEALLGLILHEMGHSFGLGHNFKASTDSANYYKSEEEIKNIFSHIDSEEISHSSSVMDYTKDTQPEMKYLGKYDLAALRYLYLDKLELKDGTLADLNIDTALTTHFKRNRKIYQHCSDFLKIKEPMCYMFDYGSNPKEIAEDDIMDVKRALNTERYRYDLEESLFVESNTLRFEVFRALYRSSLLHTRWLELRDNYLESLHQLDNTDYILNDETSISKYKELINKGLSNKEYALYYPMRDIMPKIVMELMSLEEMSCHVMDSQEKEHKLILENIKNLLKYDYGDSLYVEDCYSPQILSFFNKNDLTFIKQSGYEDFISYYPPTSPEKKFDILPISNLFTAPFIVGGGIIYPSFLSWLKEPDLLKSLNEKMQRNLLDWEKNKTLLESYKNTILFNSFIAGLQHTLNQPNKKDILTEHLNHIKFVEYKKGTSSESFFKKVIEPLSKGFPIEGIEVPFLTEAYQQYLKEHPPKNASDVSEDSKAPKQQSFFSYLLKRKDTFDDKSEQAIIMPFQMNSFSSKIIKNHNESLNQIEELEKRTDLSVIEELMKENLKQYSQTLDGFINIDSLR